MLLLRKVCKYWSNLHILRKSLYFYYTKCAMGEKIYTYCVNLCAPLTRSEKVLNWLNLHILHIYLSHFSTKCVKKINLQNFINCVIRLHKCVVRG